MQITGKIEIAGKELIVKHIENITEALDSIMRLDERAYRTHVGKQWYLDRYTNNFDGVGVYTDDGKGCHTLVGYCCICGIKSEFRDAMVNGVLDGDWSVSAEMFSDLESRFLYIPSIVVALEYRNKGIGQYMMDWIINRHCAWSKNYVLAMCNVKSAHLMSKRGAQMLHYTGEYQVAVL